MARRGSSLLCANVRPFCAMLNVWELVASIQDGVVYCNKTYLQCDVYHFRVIRLKITAWKAEFLERLDIDYFKLVLKKIISANQ